MQKEILKIQRNQGTTMVMVTHDIDEAVVLGNRVVVMSARPGEIMDVIEISPEGRKRNSKEFNAYKTKLYNYLFGKEEQDSLQLYSMTDERSKGYRPASAG